MLCNNAGDGERGEHWTLLVILGMERGKALYTVRNAGDGEGGEHWTLLVILGDSEHGTIFNFLLKKLLNVIVLYEKDRNC